MDTVFLDKESESRQARSHEPNTEEGDNFELQEIEERHLLQAQPSGDQSLHVDMPDDAALSEEQWTGWGWKKNAQILAGIGAGAGEAAALPWFVQGVWKNSGQSSRAGSRSELTDAEQDAFDDIMSRVQIARTETAHVTPPGRSEGKLAFIALVTSAATAAESAGSGQYSTQAMLTTPASADSVTPASGLHRNVTDLSVSPDNGGARFDAPVEDISAAELMQDLQLIHSMSVPDLQLVFEIENFYASLHAVFKRADQHGLPLIMQLRVLFGGGVTYPENIALPLQEIFKKSEKDFCGNCSDETQEIYTRRGARQLLEFCIINTFTTIRNLAVQGEQGRASDHYPLLQPIRQRASLS